MQDHKPGKDPDPSDPENCGNQERGRNHGEHVPEGRKKQGGKKQDGQAQCQGSGLASLLPRERSEGRNMSPERARQAEQFLREPAGRFLHLRGRRGAGAGRFQLSAENDAEQKPDPDRDADRLQRVLTDVRLPLALVGLGA